MPCTVRTALPAAEGTSRRVITSFPPVPPVIRPATTDLASSARVSSFSSTRVSASSSTRSPAPEPSRCCAASRSAARCPA